MADADADEVEVAVVETGRPGADDLVGQDVLAQFRCGYRLADGLLALNPEMPSNSQPIVLGKRKHVHLDLSWDGRDVAANAVFDTGASVTIADRAFADRRPDLFTPAGAGKGADALVGIVDLSGHAMDMILGWTVISQADWTIDHTTARATRTLR